MRTAHILRNNLFFYFLVIGLPSISTYAMETAFAYGSSFEENVSNVPTTITVQNIKIVTFPRPPMKGTYHWKQCNSYSYIARKCIVWKYCMEIEKDGSCIRSIRCDEEKCINNTRTIKKK